jgi:hypothetical protein
MYRTIRKQLTFAIVGVALTVIPCTRQVCAQSTADRTANDTRTPNS